MNACELCKTGVLPMQRILLTPALTLLPLCFAPVDASPAEPLTPEESIRQMQIADELEIQLVASEPQVIDPVAIAFDEELRLWVVEMRDYPNGPADGGKPQSRIRILLDRNHDGHYETAHTFADELLFATGLQPWQGGVIVTLAGEVVWMKDTDGDLKADIRETWFTGFTQDNPQLRANHPTFGPDNWIYIANGLRGGKVQTVHPEWAENSQPIDISGKDFRFNPITGVCESITGTGQFGLTFDRLGNRFICSNRNPCMQVVIEDRYLKRNPHLAVTRPLHDVSPAGADSKIFPISRAWTTSNLHAGQFTAACGITCHQGFGLPQPYRENFYVCDPTGNLVHRIVPDSETVLRKSISARTGVEFLASPDEWFRPVNIANGPDGALYIVDMYRAVVEHPRWVPEELKDRPDMLSGNDRGRIFRIVARTPTDAARKYSTATRIHTDDAEQNLKTDFQAPWRAETTRRLLVEKQDRKTVRALLRKVLQSESSRSSLSASQAAACLMVADGTGSLTEDLLLQFFELNSRLQQKAGSLWQVHGGDAAVLTAIRLAEPLLPQSEQLLAAVLRQPRTSSQVRFQLALSLGQHEPGGQTLQALADIAYRDASSEPHRLAVLSSAGSSPVPLLQLLWDRVEQQRAWTKPGIRKLTGELAQVIAARKVNKEIQMVRQRIAMSVKLASDLETPSESATARRRLELAAFRGLCSASSKTAVDLVQAAPSETAELMKRLFDSAAQMALDESLEETVRLEAIATLGSGYAQMEHQAITLNKIFASQTDMRLRSAALKGLARLQQDDLVNTLLGAWPTSSPGMRREIINAFLFSRKSAERLATEILDKRIERTELTAFQRTRLLRILTGTMRTSMQKMLAQSSPEDRREMIARYQPVLKMAGDPRKGQKLFEKNCSVCHRIGKVGVNVAPDISDSRTKTPAQLLDAILDPNRAVDANYFGYSLITGNGKVFSGILSAETANSVTLKQAEGRTITVLRTEIAELHNTGVSLMPVGLEKNLTRPQMADLISFIKNWRYLDGQTPFRTGRNLNLQATPADRTP